MTSPISPYLQKPKPYRRPLLLKSAEDTQKERELARLTALLKLRTERAGGKLSNANLYQNKGLLCAIKGRTPNPKSQPKVFSTQGKSLQAAFSYVQRQLTRQFLSPFQKQKEIAEEVKERFFSQAEQIRLNTEAIALEIFRSYRDSRQTCGNSEWRRRDAELLFDKQRSNFARSELGTASKTARKALHQKAVLENEVERLDIVMDNNREIDLRAPLLNTVKPLILQPDGSAEFPINE